MLKKETHKDFVIFEMNNIKESEKIDFSKINLPYTFRIIEKKGNYTHRTIISYDKDGNFEQKIFFLENQNDIEIQNIEYDKNDNIIQRVEFENYPNGETKNMYVYDDKEKLIHHQFFEEDLIK